MKTTVTENIVPAPTVESGLPLTKQVTYKTYKVMLHLPVPIPMEKNCWIKVTMPKSLSIVTEKTTMSGYGIFKSEEGSFFEVETPGEKREFVFKGCNH